MKFAVLVLAMLLNGVAVAEEFFATVGDEGISWAEYEAHVDAGLRQRYFHGKVPEAEMQAFREEMAQELIDRVLLVQEARRRGLQPQSADVEAEIEQTRQRYRHNPAWTEQEETVVARLRQAVIKRDLIDQLRKQVNEQALQMASASAEEAAVRQYYDEHPQQFTTPEQLRLSLILLGVEPWSPQVKWQAAEQEAEKLVQKLQSGQAEFGELARLHSSDASSSRGGDLGYIHLGMLSAEAQKHVEGLKTGEIAAPLRLLQGIAIFRLDGRKPAQLNGFEQVRERARGLMQRQQQQQAWQQLITELRQRTPVKRNDVKMNHDG